jgi:ribosomal protein L3
MFFWGSIYIKNCFEKNEFLTPETAWERGQGFQGTIRKGGINKYKHRRFSRIYYV